MSRLLERHPGKRGECRACDYREPHSAEACRLNRRIHGAGMTYVAIPPGTIVAERPGEPWAEVEQQSGKYYFRVRDAVASRMWKRGEFFVVALRSYQDEAGWECGTCGRENFEPTCVCEGAFGYAHAEGAPTRGFLGDAAW